MLEMVKARSIKPGGFPRRSRTSNILLGSRHRVLAIAPLVLVFYLYMKLKSHRQYGWSPTASDQDQRTAILDNQDTLERRDHLTGSDKITKHKKEHDTSAGEVTPSSKTLDWRLYIYEGPVVDMMTKGLLRCMPDFPKLQDAAEYWIHKALQVHHRRTLDPNAANLFFMPSYNCLSSMLWKNTVCNGTRHLERMKMLGEFIKASAFYQRNGGSDHVLVCQSHYCPFRMLRREPGQLLASGFLLMHEKNPVWSFNWCPYRIVTIPYVSQEFGPPQSLKGQRKWLISFHGSLTRDWKVTWDDVVRNRTGAIVPSGSELRGKLKEIAHMERVNIRFLSRGAGFNFDEMGPSEREQFEASYRSVMLSSTFCFHIKGDTPTSRRFFDAIAAGCIPVIISDGMRQNTPFPWRLDYEGFTVSVPEREWLRSPTDVVKRLHRLERSPGDIERMRGSLLLAASHLDYRGFDGMGSVDGESLLVDDVLEEIMHRKTLCPAQPCCREWVDETKTVLTTRRENFPRQPRSILPDRNPN